MEGGILEVGTGSPLSLSDSYCFVLVTGGRLIISNIEIKFKIGLRHVIFIKGGNINLEYITINNQISDNWRCPIVDVFPNFKSVILNIFSWNIINSTYECSETENSSVINFNPFNNEFYILLNMTFCFFENNSFLANENSKGGFCNFNSPTIPSGYYLFIYIFIFFALELYI
jgi:hypothetical protein